MKEFHAQEIEEIACAQGQFVFFVDADDCLDKNALKACVIHQTRTNTIVALNYDRISKEEQRSESSCVADVRKVPFCKIEKEDKCWTWCLSGEDAIFGGCLYLKC